MKGGQGQAGQGEKTRRLWQQVSYMASDWGSAPRGPLEKLCSFNLRIAPLRGRKAGDHPIHLLFASWVEALLSS